MSQSKPRFYLDENMNPQIAIQLARRGIDATAARDVGMLRKSDPEQLRFAVEHGRVLCTEDSDFPKMADAGLEHSGIAYFPKGNLGIGYAVSALQDLYQNETAESMMNSLRYL